MDAKLRQIVSKAAGTYFIVTDVSQVATIEAESKMRLFFINTEKGPVNALFKFAKGDSAGFTSIFGKNTRLQEKKGNFSTSSCLEALAVGPIAVINLRTFSDADVAGVVGLNPNIVLTDTAIVGYDTLFNKNGFWVPKAQNIIESLSGETLLNFANVGNSDLSVIVKFATDAEVLTLTTEGEKTLKNCALEIDEYPALDFNMLLKSTFVTVYVFNATFTNPNTNPYYGHLFNASGNVDVTRLTELMAIPEAGYSQKITGSLIPGLISELNESISIDTIVNQNYMTSGIISFIDDSLFELDNKSLLDITASEFYDSNGAKVSGTSNYLLSHVVPVTLTTSTTVYPLTLANQNVFPTASNLTKYACIKVDANSFEASFEQGLRIGDKIKGFDGFVVVDSIVTLDVNAAIGSTSSKYTKVKYVCSGPIDFEETTVTEPIPEVPEVPEVPAIIGTGTEQNPEFSAVPAVPAVPGVYTYKAIKLTNVTNTGYVKPFGLVGYKPRLAQFIDGTATKQSEILDMMVSPGIVKGIKSTTGIRYVVDCFKSYVEPSYKSQFGSLMVSLDEGNRFVRAILNEPFMEDMQNSINPLFKQTPTGSFDWAYVPEGGNKTYSSKLLTKFNLGSDMSFFFGPGNEVGSVMKPLAALISNLFYSKTFAFDVVANSSGYVDGITKLESEIDDNERVFCEKFNYNPIIYFNGGNTIFGNMTGQKANTAQRQIHNSELLAFIKESLYNLSKGESFKKANYDDYLRTETESSNFMNNLALAGAIEANPIVICNASNNTPEIAKQKIKLVHIEYTPINALEKVVFDLKIN